MSKGLSKVAITLRRDEPDKEGFEFALRTSNERIVQRKLVVVAQRRIKVLEQGSSRGAKGLHCRFATTSLNLAKGVRLSISPRIDSKRLVLEALTQNHAEVLFQGLSDERLFEFIDDHPPASIEVLRAKYQRLERRASPDGREIWLNWAVRKRDKGPYIGFVQATISEDRSATVAYLLFREDGGQGYAREAVIAMLNHLREAYEITVFRAAVDPRNRRSTALLESLGFELLQCRVGVATVRGVLVDELDYVLG